jgi:hypothetical protein
VKHSTGRRRRAALIERAERWEGALSSASNFDSNHSGERGMSTCACTSSDLQFQELLGPLQSDVEISQSERGRWGCGGRKGNWGLPPEIDETMCVNFTCRIKKRRTPSSLPFCRSPKIRAVGASALTPSPHSSYGAQ